MPKLPFELGIGHSTSRRPTASRRATSSGCATGPLPGGEPPEGLDRGRGQAIVGYGRGRRLVGYRVRARVQGRRPGSRLRRSAAGAPTSGRTPCASCRRVGGRAGRPAPRRVEGPARFFRSTWLRRGRRRPVTIRARRHRRSTGRRREPFARHWIYGTRTEPRQDGHEGNCRRRGIARRTATARVGTRTPMLRDRGRERVETRCCSPSRTKPGRGTDTAHSNRPGDVLVEQGEPEEETRYESAVTACSR